jgi:AcrR family transcriptional regulator
MNQSTPKTNADDGRDRLIDAVVAETVEVGYGAVSVEGIVRRARASQASFEARFADERAAVGAAYECRFEYYFRRLLRACKAQSDWPLKVKVGIGVTLDMAAATPVDAQFLAVETMAVGDDFLQRVLDSRDRLARLLLSGRTESRYGAELPGITEAVLVAGVAGVISAQLRAGETKHLPAVAPQLVELTLTPYLGREKAVEVARRPRPRVEGDHDSGAEG